MTLFLLLNPVKNITAVGQNEGVTGGHYGPDIYVPAPKKKRRKKTKATLRRLSELRGESPRASNLVLRHVPQEIKDDLAKTKVKAEAAQLISALKDKIIELNYTDLINKHKATIEKAQMLEAWQHVQDEMLIMFMFTEGEC